MKHIVILSGAGISADSGLKTFRDADGLWEGHDIQEVATIDGWNNNKEKVLDFYNQRRKQAFEAQPNQAHFALAELEKSFRVSVVTQNVDDLHERAGSGNVIHLHGLLKEARSIKNPDLIVEIGDQPIQIGDTGSDGAQLRPNIIWFGEPVPMIEEAIDIVKEADLFMVIGTSLAVYPAAGLIHYLKPKIPKFIVDPSVPDSISLTGWTHIQKNAAKGVPELVKTLIQKN